MESGAGDQVPLRFSVTELSPVEKELADVAVRTCPLPVPARMTTFNGSSAVVNQVVGLLAVLKAGGAYVPLDPGYPKARLALMARGAGVRFIISDSAHRPRHVYEKNKGNRGFNLDPL